MKRSPLRRSAPEARLYVPVIKTCKCGREFTPRSSTHRVCSPKCAIKAVKEQDKQRKEDARPLSWWINRAERMVNKYVRLRDHSDGCISCDKPATWGGQWHCSHFRSVGAASAVRWHLWNMHKGCSECNHYKSGNLSEYEPRLRQKIGDERVDWLRTQNQIVRYSREYLDRLHNVFAKKVRRLEKRIANAIS